jgi:hypothetical protein
MTSSLSIGHDLYINEDIYGIQASLQTPCRYP